MATSCLRDTTLRRSKTGKALSSPFNSNRPSRPAIPPAAAATMSSSSSKSPAAPSTPKGKAKTSSSSIWSSVSPRYLMQKASIALKGGKSRSKRHRGRVDIPASVTTKASTFSDADHVPEESPTAVVAEKIILEDAETVKMNDAIMMEAVKEAIASALAPTPLDAKKWVPVPEPEQEPAALPKEARFEGSKVKTAMQKRTEEEQPKRKEVVRSNDVIEEARAKLLEKKHSKVKALVGAFETVIEAKPGKCGD